eukprot:TRINITY_DN585_c0_g4_i2.p1 TRINITY_DN585_c0_g4~~TRINITY_DN585_c0_g4_i2.p1  ORF type:complete len:316 (+),score=62.40 TRINITY_DN585_c0_g4_i2:107-1054(+)
MEAVTPYIEKFVEVCEEKHLVNNLNKVLVENFQFTTEEFNFVHGVTPLSTIESVLIGGLGYLATIFVLEKFMNQFKSGFKGFFFNTIVAIHNFFLTLVSLGLLILMIEHLFPIYYHHGIWFTFCDITVYVNSNMMFFVYVNYLIKYYEFIDTFFLVLKKKPLTFLHVFHHSMTMLLTYTQQHGHTTVQWVPITLNLSVHVLMYFYYFLSGIGVRCWWKQYVTYLQILQFVLDLIVCYLCSWVLFSAFLDIPKLPVPIDDCYGTPNAAIFGCGLLTSYLFLFIQFFIVTYFGKKPSQPEEKPKSKPNNRKNKKKRN